LSKAFIFKEETMNKKIKLLLVTSLILNMLLAGFLVGEHVRRQARRESSQIVRTFAETYRVERDQIAAERAAALAMLQQAELDVDAYAAQVDKISAMQESLFKAFAIEMADKLRAMPAAERDALIARIKQRSAGPRRGQR